MFDQAAKAGAQIAEAYEACDNAKAMRLIMELADRANPFVENAQPWVLAKDLQQRGDELRDVCTVALNLFRQIAIYLAPVLPKLALQCSELLGEPMVNWNQSQKPLLGTTVNKFEHMLGRVKKEEVEAMIEDSKEAVAVNEAAATELAGDTWSDSDEPLKAEPMAETCSIDDFVKIDLRVARVIAAEQVPEARKLLKLTLSLGGDVRKTVFAGIKAAYEPEKLIGRLVVCVANLAPRQMKFGLSEGMVTAAGPGGEEVFLLAIDTGAIPGMRVH